MNQLYKQRPSSIKLILLLFVSLPYIGVGQAITTVQDFDGNTYPTALIGEQEWMAENLNVSKFRNGDPIPQATSDKEWLEAKKNKTPIWSYYDYNPDNGKKYGKLYNWYAVNDSRGLAPEGFIVPKNSHWKALAEYLASNDFEDYDLKSENGWHDNEGNNTSGFSAQASGYRYNDTTYFTDESEENQEFMPFAFANLEFQAYWWTSTEISKNTACAWKLEYEIEADDEWNIKTNGFAVRCIKDDKQIKNNSAVTTINPDPGQFIDNRDGKSYKTVKIGNQIWMAENLSFRPENGKYAEVKIDTINSQGFGLFYEFETALKACPVGWKLPTSQDWNSLNQTIDSIAFIKSVNGWMGYEETIVVSNGMDGYNDTNYMWGEAMWVGTGKMLSGNGNNKLFFNAMPAGEWGLVVNDYYTTNIRNVGLYAEWWIEDKGYVSLMHQFPGLSVRKGSNVSDSYKNVRCIKEAEKDIIELEREGPEEIIIETETEQKPKPKTKENNSKEDAKEIIKSIRGIFRR